MSKPLHPDYIYIDAELLKERVAYHKPSGWLICESKGPDGKFVSYSPKELKMFMDTGEPITLAVHNVKKIIGGEVVEYGHTDGKGNGNLGKPNEEKRPDGSDNASHNGGKIQGNSENVPISRGGELEIF